ncbi:hypothetical protein EOB36_28330 [Mesorhizobium sp. M6A.T.Cr.TU.017.01.1.1]|nr:hypothetical protein EOB36_28330 [Mesorhizobium sp. M6A.T.Cr.TU.017.01.1.1]
MKIWIIFPRLLSILAVVSLLTAPMVTASAALTMVVEPAASMADMASMPDSMPNCPDESQPAPDCQKSCPLTALCVAKCFPSASTAAAIMLARLSQADLLAPGDRDGRDLPASPPPPRPPRT